MTNKSPYFKELNFNPAKKRIPDCAVRAVSAALALRYSTVCRIFGKRFRPGYGLVGNEGIDLNDVKRRFDRFFDVVEDSRETSWEFRPDEFDDLEFDPVIDQDEDFGYTLGEFCEFYSGQGRFLVALTTDHKTRYLTGETSGHIVFCDLRPGKDCFVDTWDSSWMRVQAFMRVRKVWPPSDPNSLLHGKWLEAHPEKKNAARN